MNGYIQLLKIVLKQSNTPDKRRIKDSIVSFIQKEEDAQVISNFLRKTKIKQSEMCNFDPVFQSVLNMALKKRRGLPKKYRDKVYDFMKKNSSI